MIIFLLPDQYFYILNKEFSNDGGVDIILKIQIYGIPIILSLAQFLLSILVYKIETPRYLMENNLNEYCIEVLSKFYPDNDRRIKETEIQYYLLNKTRYQYPSYYELFTRKYRNLLLQGILIITIRSFTGYFQFLFFIAKIFPNYFKYTDIILGSMNLIGILIPLFLIDSNSN